MTNFPKKNALLGALTACSIVSLSPLGCLQAWEAQQIEIAVGKLDQSRKDLWYRTYLKVDKRLVIPSADPKDLWRESMTLALQDIPGEFTVFLNGVEIIKSKNISKEVPLRYKVPKDILKEDTFNSLVIHLSGKAAQQGLRYAPVFGGYLDEVRLNKAWQVSTAAPTPQDFEVTAQADESFAYIPKDWRPANTVLARPEKWVKGLQVSPEDALKKLKVSEGLAIDALFSEPQVAQPTHVSFDGKGRMWIAQYRQYPYPAGLKMISRDAYYRGKYDKVPPAPPHHDKGADIVSVHEDTDGDGQYDKQTNVLTGLNMANAAIHGHGGIWVMHCPYLLFYPDTNQDGLPDGDPQVMLSGFGIEDTHSSANGLVWGPDGWLYGGQGSTVTSHITQPGSDKEPYYFEGCGVWRFHPKTKQFEIFADGSGNTFGIYFDAEGRLYSGHNGGVIRGWHLIQEGFYLKQGLAPDKFGPPLNPYAFGQLQGMKSTNPVPRFSHNIIVAEGNAMPERLKGKLIGADPLHQNLTASDLTPTASTFTTTDIDFPVQADDMTFRPVYLINAPDGSLTIADFREQYIAHGQNYQGQVDPDSGRIYRLRGKDLPLNKDINLEAKTSEELVGILAHPNHWHRHTAVRLLGERREPKIADLLKKKLREEEAFQTQTHPALEATWVLGQLGALDDAFATELLGHKQAMVRAWVIRLKGDSQLLSSNFEAAVFKALSKEENPEVRLQALSTARRLPTKSALALASAILNRDLDQEDAFIPMMAWFTLEDRCAKEAKSVLELFQPTSQLWSKAMVRGYITPRIMQRFAASGTRQELLYCAELFENAPSEDDKKALLQGFEDAFKGRALPPLPDALAQSLSKLGKGTLVMRVRQKEDAAIEEALVQLSDEKAAVEQRVMIAKLFGEVKTPAAEATLLKLANDAKVSNLVREASLSALTLYDTPTIGDQVVALVNDEKASVRDAVLNLLATRPAWSLQLLDSIQSKRTPSNLLTVDYAERLKLHKNEKVNAWLAEFGPEKVALEQDAVRAEIARITGVLKAAPGDPYAGEAIYMERCAACHKLFFKGGLVGPNLTAYQREDLGTMLLSIVNPNAEIREGFGNMFITTHDGRSFGGFLADQDANVVVIRGFDGNDFTLLRKDINTMEAAGRSLMPEGLLLGLNEKQLRDLFAYLRISQPITK